MTKERDFALRHHGMRHAIHLDSIARLLTKLDWCEDLLPLAFLHDIEYVVPLGIVISEFGEEIGKKIRNLQDGSITDDRLACVACADRICHMLECETEEDLDQEISRRSLLIKRTLAIPTAGWLWEDMLRIGRGMMDVDLGPQTSSSSRRSPGARRACSTYSMPPSWLDAMAIPTSANNWSWLDNTAIASSPANAESITAPTSVYLSGGQLNVFTSTLNYAPVVWTDESHGTVGGTL